MIRPCTPEAHALAPPDGRSAHDEALDTLCRIAGVSGVHAYLSLAPNASAKEGLIALERKRREMERALSDPRREREADLFLEHYDALREVVAPAAVPSPDLTGDVPDYYRALDVDPSAPFGDIEAAWREATLRGRDADPRVAQAWRVLGDPLTRANYDRMRRERAAADARRTSPLLVDARSPAPASNRPPSHTPPAQASPSVCEVLGAEVREVTLESAGPETAIVSLVVHGTTRWTCALSSDHPALTTRPEHGLSLAPGRHTLVVRLDPAKVGKGTVSCTLTLSNAHETHNVVFRLRRATAGPRRPWEAFAMGAGAFAMLIVAVLVGNMLSVTPHDDPPTTVGLIAQLPSVAACLTPANAPLPGYVDVHTDGFGRPSGVTFGGAASLAADTCVRAAVVKLSFPLTPDGLPAVHRYRLTPSTGTP